MRLSELARSKIVSAFVSQIRQRFDEAILRVNSKATDTPTLRRSYFESKQSNDGQFLDIAKRLGDAKAAAEATARQLVNQQITSFARELDG